jgi:putative Mn2+ efflux pump MntP
MDAFAVAICKGLALSKTKLKHYIIIGVWFGGFQALMPLIGYYLGSAFSAYIQKFDHWIAFILLCFIGGHMIKESFCCCDEDEEKAGLAFLTMLPLAVATSIDALAVGVTFAFYSINIWIAVAIIGLITFIISAAGVKIGNIFGTRYSQKAEMAGGAILIIIAIKLLAEGLING